MITYTEEDWKLLERSGGDGWKTKQFVLNEISMYEDNREYFNNNGFTEDIYKDSTLLSLLMVWDSFHLFTHASQLVDGSTYLEVGSYVGGSLRLVNNATKGKDNVSFIAVDCLCNDDYHTRRGETLQQVFFDNTRGINNLTAHIRFSDIACTLIEDLSVDLLFIDGSHEYEQVKKDIVNYWTKVKINGTIFMHDFDDTHPGVVKAVLEVLRGIVYTKMDRSNLIRIVKTGELE